jgi:two-component system LytT family sensor kinase
LISISFKRDKENMMVAITDNGTGFSAGKPTNGFGLKLTSDRIKLLNELKNDQPIQLEIKGNSPSGTKVYLTFKNWFL